MIFSAGTFMDRTGRFMFSTGVLMFSKAALMFSVGVLMFAAGTLRFNKGTLKAIVATMNRTVSGLPKATLVPVVLMRFLSDVGEGAQKASIVPAGRRRSRWFTLHIHAR